MIDIAGFEDDSITNGPGLRFVIFTQGCPHRCAGCHNPSTHEFGSGEKHSVDDIYNRIKANPLITGVTFSGGEPFCQAEELSLLAEKLKADGYELAVYSGFTFEELLAQEDPYVRKLLALADVLVDGPFDLESRDLLLRFKGSRNQRILDLPDSLQKKMPVIIANPRWQGRA